MLDVREAQRSQLRALDRLTLSPPRWHSMMHALKYLFPLFYDLNSLLFSYYHIKD